jgi:hypothetical protein
MITFVTVAYGIHGFDISYAGPDVTEAVAAAKRALQGGRTEVEVQGWENGVQSLLVPVEPVAVGLPASDPDPKAHR